jgi:hypothetical protein
LEGVLKRDLACSKPLRSENKQRDQEASESLRCLKGGNTKFEHEGDFFGKQDDGQQ